ncbi:MAG: AraC family transcriptional regulator [Lachnospiraceae bacterium]|nr:AraC family transcriptional regulator [Candidatus Colinaster equi]
MEEKESIVIQNEVINKAITYIFEHIDEDITVDDVAKHCAYSKYHLMRMFKEDTEEALYQFIKRIRIERSALRLKMDKETSITEIGADYGYSSSNFSTAFKKHMNQSPADFRKNSERIAESSAFFHGESLDSAAENEELISIEHLNDILVVYERRKGNYHNLNYEWCEFIKRYEYLVAEDTLYLDCTIDDPSITDENGCMYELCQTVQPDHPALNSHPELLLNRFEGGKYGVYHFKGYPRYLFMVYQEIFCRWLAKTGNRLERNKPIFDIYRKVEADGYLEMDICFPLCEY